MTGRLTAFRLAFASWRAGWRARSTALAVLAVAVAAHLTVLGFWNRAVHRDLPVEAPDRIVRLSLSGDSTRPRLVHEETAFLVRATTLDWVRHTASLPVHLVGGEFPVPVEALLVGEGLLTDLGAAPALGRLFAPEDHLRPPVEDAAGLVGPGHPVVVVSHDFWRSRLGGGADLAATALDLRLGSGTETVRARVVGVMPEGFVFPDDDTDLWYPLAAPRSDLDFAAAIRENAAPDGVGFTLRSGPVGFAWGRLAAGRTLPEAREELTALLERRREVAPFVEYRRGRAAVSLTPLRDALIEPVARSLRLLALGAGLLLAVAALSALGLLFAAHLADLGDRWVRRSVGAGAGDELALSLARTLVGAIPLAVVSLFLADWFGAVLHRYGSGIFGPEASVRALPTAGYAFAVSLLVCLIAETPSLLALVPSGGRRDFASRRGARVRFAALVAGVAASTLMLGSVTGLALSAARLLRGADSYASDLVLVDLGQRPEYPATFGDPDREDTLRRRVEALPEVERAAFAAVLPDQPSDRFHQIYDDDDATGWRFDLRHVSPGFFETVGLSLLEGRGFLPDDLEEATPAVVVDEAFARRYGLGEIGTGIFRRCRGCSGLVVGRSAPMPSFPDGLVRPTMYSLGAVSASHFEHPRSRFSMLVKPSGGGADIVGAVAGALRGGLPGVEVLRVRTAGERRRELLREGVALSAALAVLAVAAFLLSLASCAGQVAEERRRRRREQAIRAAVGAPPSRLSRETGRRSASGAVAGILLGSAGVLLLHRGLAGRFDWVAAPPVESLLGPAVLLAFALGVIGLAARRGFPRNPMEALRPED